MKKLFSFAAVALALCVSVGAMAQDRRSWDFTKGLSAETTANLKADAANWGNDSKGETSSEADGTPRSWTNLFKITETQELKANDVVIAELAGIKINTSGVSSKEDIRIGVQTETLRPIMGLSDDCGRFRLCRAKMSFQLPPLVAGQKVVIDYMSSAPSDKGGGRYLSSEQMTPIDGAPEGNAYKDLTRYVVTFQVNDDIVEPTEITVTTTNGVDIFSIEIDGGGSSVEEAKKVAYVTGDADSDFILQIIDESRLEATPIDAGNAEVTLADLQEYEAVIVSPFMAADAAIVPVLKSAIAYEPMVNLNAALYEAWGLGTATPTDAQSVTLTAAFAEDANYAAIATGDAIVMDGVLSAITLGDYFANDAVIATIGESVAMHRHNAGRNTYLNVPMTAECVPNFDIFGTFLGDIAVYAAGTKRTVTAAAAPAITQANGDQVTTVTISAADGAVIYYTTDGTEPTVESTVYTEPLVLTADATIKAFVTADGYLPSPVATLDAVIMGKVATPTFALTQDEASTTVEIQTATPDAEIYYSYREFTDYNKAQKYEGAITLSEEPTYIYALAIAENHVASDLSSEYVAIKSLNAQTIRMDTVSHFSSCQAAWMPVEPAEGSTGAASAHYYWGKSAWSYYSEEVDHTEIVTDEEGNEVEKTYYKPDPNALKVIYPNADNGTENDWRIASSGQVLVGELTGAVADGVGEPTGAVLAGRYADTAEDLIGGLSTKGFMSFKAVQSGNPNSGAIESVKAFKAPFDVVVYVGNGSGGNKYAEVQISTDGQTWEKYADLKVSTVKRYIKKTRVAVNDEGSYYVRVANVSNGLNVGDIYILNNGEVSQAYEPEAGIKDIEVSDAYVVRTEVYSINGMKTSRLNRGVNIVRTYYSDGSVMTAKVLNR